MKIAVGAVALHAASAVFGGVLFPTHADDSIARSTTTIDEDRYGNRLATVNGPGVQAPQQWRLL